MDIKKIAIVICFRDWGLDKLSVTIQHLKKSSILEQIDIVVSDYGSKKMEAVRKVVIEAGGRVIRTESDGPWNRSRALNNGIRGTSTPYILTSDSDAIFSPQAVENIVHLLDIDSHTFHAIQYRNLTEHFGVAKAACADIDILEENSFPRPRWGMGIMAFRRKDFDTICGYDERMEHYGAEDNDFALRLVRSGLRLNWVDDQQTRVYHIWHPSTLAIVEGDPQQKSALDLNQSILKNDTSWVRNTKTEGNAHPIASVLISTRNRAGYLLDAIHSALFQTVKDIEILVMDDGSDDETPDILSSVEDPRVRIMRQAPLGLPAARNKLMAAVRSPFVVIHDDDDVMLPWRIEAHLKALTSDVVGTYGGWANFDNATGEVQIFQGREYDAKSFTYTGKVMTHGTLMIRADILKRFSYREFMAAGSDWNLMTRIANAGYKFNHTRELLILRRMHHTNLTITLQDRQKKAAIRTTNILRQRNSASKEKQLREIARNIKTINCNNIIEFEEKVRPFLPDHLTQRCVIIHNASPESIERLRTMFNRTKIHLFGWTDALDLKLIGLKLIDLVLLTRITDIDFTVSHVPYEICKHDDETNIIDQILNVLPSSGLIDMESINFVAITSKADGQLSTELDNVKKNDSLRRIRIWRFECNSYYVHVISIESISNATSIIDSYANVATSIVIPPEIPFSLNIPAED